MIKEQVQLPLHVALTVAMQGIRIRFGRSVVTILGVALGIAFLMAMLAGMALNRGVAGEDRARAEARRMLNFLTVESGSLNGKTASIICTGPLDPFEERLVGQLSAAGLEELRWTALAGTPPPAVSSGAPFRQTYLSGAGDGASALIVMGAGPPPDIVWKPVLAGMRKQLAAFTRAIPASPPGDAHTTIVSLSREPSADERERAAAEKRRAAARQLWVIVISLAVTVIGISNAMLMSVTERFREIGTMKCLGALSSFIRMLFLIESAFVGAVGSVAGCAAGALFAALAYTGIYGLALTTRSAYGQLSSLALYAAAAVAAGMVLSVVAAIYPASVASRMVPANALRSNV